MPQREALPECAWSVVVHGGARSIPEADRPLFERGCLAAVHRASAILSEGGTALDAAEAAVRVLEDLPQFNAGTGSVANEEGEIEMDAAIMDGRTLAIGGVAALRDVKNPIGVARALLADNAVLLSGAGAQKYAANIAAPRGSMPPSDDPSGGDTVGCVARDVHGHLAAAGSTGGISGKRVGRIGDTPLPGCGFYADDQMGAAALSGEGEAIMRGMLAARALHTLGSTSPETAVDETIHVLKRTGGEAGIILIATNGRIAIAHNSQQFSVGLAASWIDEPRAGTHIDDVREWIA